VVDIAERKTEIGIGLFLLIAVGAFLVIPAVFPADTIILTAPSGFVDSCANPNLILAQNLTDLCDVTIISPLTNELLSYNGTQWVNVDFASFNNTATCSNIGNGTAFVCVEGSQDPIQFRSILAGAGISVSNTTNTVTITNTAPDNTVCANVGIGDAQVYKDGECNFRTLIQGNNIQLTEAANTIVIDVVGIDPESTECTNLGTVGEGVFVGRSVVRFFG